MTELAGRQVLITGAGRGLGLEIARACGQAGARLVIADINEQTLDQASSELGESGFDVLAVAMDISSPESVSDGFEKIGDDLWGVVNNAALADAVGGQYFWELDTETWQRLLTVNVTGTWLVSRAAAQVLRSQRGGRIINMASDAALYGSARLSHYVTSKGAVIAMTRAMARDIGPYGVTVNAVAPGIVVGESTVNVPEERHGLYETNRALSRTQMPDDVSGVVTFLLSEAAGYVTGQTIVVDGGFVMP